MPNKNGNIIIDTALYGPVSLCQDVKHNEVMGYDKHSFKAQIGGLHGIYVTFSTFEEAVTRLTSTSTTLKEQWLKFNNRRGARTYPSH